MENKALEELKEPRGLGWRKNELANFLPDRSKEGKERAITLLGMQIKAFEGRDELPSREFSLDGGKKKLYIYSGS